MIDPERLRHGLLSLSEEEVIRMTNEVTAQGNAAERIVAMILSAEDPVALELADALGWGADVRATLAQTPAGCVPLVRGCAERGYVAAYLIEKFGMDAARAVMETPAPRVPVCVLAFGGVTVAETPHGGGAGCAEA